jgi:hypothetical protein
VGAQGKLTPKPRGQQYILDNSFEDGTQMSFPKTNVHRRISGCSRLGEWSRF